jgi:hypothetical protein
MPLWPEAGVVVECPCWDIDRASIHHGQRSTTYRAERPSIPRRFRVHRRLVSLDQGWSTDPLEFRCLEISSALNAEPLDFLQREQ